MDFLSVLSGEFFFFWSGDFLFLFLFLVWWIFSFFWSGGFLSFFLLDLSVLYSVFDIREDNEGFFTMVSCVIQIIKFY